MLIQKTRLRANDEVTETEDPVQQLESQASSSQKEHFYEFDSDEDSTTQNAIESEVNDYLSNAK